MNKLLILVALLIIACSNDNGTTVSYAPQTCTVVQNGTNTVITCPDGTTSSIPNGTQLQIVQFCPGTTNYPNEFNEIGICVDNNLYANYSLNNGFLTLVPPGYYNSNAVGSNCNFTVTSSCGIINQ